MNAFDLSDLAALTAQLRGLLDDATRLYRLEGEGALSRLLVQAFTQHDALDQPWHMQVLALSADATIEPGTLLGQKLTLWTRLADGSEFPRSGIVTEASAEDSDGGFSRYRLSVQPWLALLAHTRRSQVWQERSVIEIVESVFSTYPQAAWQWAPCVAAHLEGSANAGVRSYTVQYRESDLAFVQRLLAREGIAMRFERTDDAPLGHTLVLLADSPSRESCSEDPTSASVMGAQIGGGGNGIRFHASGAQQMQDAIQALGARRRLPVAVSTALSWDYKAKRAVATSVPTAASHSGANAPVLEDYDHAGTYAFPDSAQAERALRLMQQAHEARHKAWLGRSTVRTFTAGQWFQLKSSELDMLAAVAESHKDDEARRFLITQVTHAGINNLPQALSEAVARSLGDMALPIDEDVKAQAAATGYGNSFDATRAQVPWRPQLSDDTGARRHVAPTAPGVLTATVVGPDGQTQGNGADEIHTDKLGRVRLRFDFQAQSQSSPTQTITGASSTWVRVMQRWAGAGMGAQFIPRIGQEVLVDFVDGDIERPLVIGALYNGQGEAGVTPTPGGAAANSGSNNASNNTNTSDTTALKTSGDQRPGAQGNLAAGHSPAWHGAGAADIAAGGQRNAAALSGTKTQEFGGTGFNQLVFDDSDGQLRTQLATTQHNTQLNLGHLIHQADNHRGSFRGLGFELRTDAYGAIRASRGVLISTYGNAANEPAGDNAAGIALQGQLATLAQSFSQVAGTHQTVKLASHIGSTRANHSVLNEAQAPANALHTTLKGMVAEANFDTAQTNAAEKSTATGNGKLPHTSAAVVEIAAKAGLATVAGQHIQWSAAESVTLASGQDTHIATGGASRIHTGQAIGVLAGAVSPGDKAAGKGITLIAGAGDIEIQAQADTMQVAAQQDLSIQSQSSHIDWAAAKRIVLATAGGASVTLEGGNITVECPGKILVQAAQKSFVGPEGASYEMPQMPNAICAECLLKAIRSKSPLAVLS